MILLIESVKYIISRVNCLETSNSECGMLWYKQL